MGVEVCHDDDVVTTAVEELVECVRKIGWTGRVSGDVDVMKRYSSHQQVLP